MRSFSLLFDQVESSFTIEDPVAHKEGVLRFTLTMVPPDSPEETRTVELVIRDKKQEIDGIPVHTGLALSVEADAESLDAAMVEATNLLSATLAFLGLAGNVTVAADGLRVAAAKETTAASQTTECLAVEELRGPMFENRRRVEEWAVKDLPALMGRLYAADERLGRAIAWYRRGMNQGNVVDRLLMFWMGLENLDPLLRQKIGEEPEIRQCSNCGSDYEAPVAKGVKAFFRDYSPNGLSDFKAVRDLRVDVVHGHGSLPDVIDRIQRTGASEICRKALRTAIMLLLDMTRWIAEDPTPILNLAEPRVECRVVYAAPPAAVKDFASLEYRTQQYLADGKRGTTCASTVIGNAGVPVAECRCRCYSEPHMEISQVLEDQQAG